MLLPRIHACNNTRVSSKPLTPRMKSVIQKRVRPSAVHPDSRNVITRETESSQQNRKNHQHQVQAENSKGKGPDKLRDFGVSRFSGFRVCGGVEEFQTTIVTRVAIT